VVLRGDVPRDGQAVAGRGRAGAGEADVGIPDAAPHHVVDQLELLAQSRGGHVRRLYPVAQRLVEEGAAVRPRGDPGAAGATPVKQHRTLRSIRQPGS
jgi:hypothetical protein